MAEIRTIAVIGAGAPGREIAQLSALGGYLTILEDILPASLRRAESEIHDALNRAAKNSTITPAAAEAALARLEYATSIEQAARAADLIIEAVPDELESKIEIFTLLDKVARPATIVASTAFSTSVTELASVTYRGKKVLGMRFSAERLEIIRGLETDEETVAACAEVGRKMGKAVRIEEERSGATHLSG